MERKRTLTMNWDALGDYDDDDDRFFETCDRVSSVVPLDMASSGSDDDDEDFEDSRMSFASAISTTEFRNYAAAAATMPPDYDIWMAAPGSITERRKRLLQGMGLAGGSMADHQDLIRVATRKDLSRVISKKLMANGGHVAPPPPPPPPPPNNNGKDDKDQDRDHGGAGDSKQDTDTPSQSPLPAVLLVRSRSDSDIEAFSVDKKRKEDVLGAVSKQRLTKTSSLIIVSNAARICPYQESVRVSSKDAEGNERSVRHSRGLTSLVSNTRFGAFFLIKNLDTGKEFIVNEYDQDGMWNRVSDLQTGKQLTLEEFEKCVGHSPVVKELMRRANVHDCYGNERKLGANSYLSKSLRMSKRRGAALLKNIKGVAHSMSKSGLLGDKERENSAAAAAAAAVAEEKQNGTKNSPSQSGWIKVRQTGKSYRELSALYLCQEIQAHEGSIWTIQFSCDGRFLATGGEDRVIHVWEVQDCEIMSLPEGNLTQIHPSLSNSTPSLGEVTPLPSEKKKKKKGSSSRTGNPIPEYVHVPETVFALSEKPVYSFTGHLDDILALSWSRSQLLLSSSMDKTVRLWDMETKSCLKLFAHNDYVTCIHFNPMDDNYFISGSLDNKVRIWNIPDRQLEDWADLHEMVTAVCYTPDGQGAFIGSHSGSCRMYRIEDGNLNQNDPVDVKYKKKSNKKITGFQFSPENPTEVLVSSADSRIRILDGSELVHKFKGLRNINSQISASFSLNGKYVISASEDSQVYLWKREEHRAGTGKGKNLIHTRGHEHFQCKDVSVAVPWPGTVKGDPPPVQVHSKNKSKKSTAIASSQPPSTCGSPTRDEAAVNGSRRHFPPSPSESPTREDNNSPAAATNNNRQLPPLPTKKKKKNNDNNNNTNIDRVPTPPEEELSSQISRTDSGIGDSFISNSSSIRCGDSPSISSSNAATPSSSRPSSWSWFDNGNHQVIQPTAWGLVIVTATLGGEIRAYQNFGLPRRIGRQANLF